MHMTKITHRLGWTLIGLVIGALMTSSLGAARPQLRQNPEPRLVITPAPVSGPNNGVIWSSLVFIKDQKGSGCWLAYSKGTEGISSIVTAPPGSCD
jgi:hypothetical protein